MITRESPKTESPKTVLVLGDHPLLTVGLAQSFSAAGLTVIIGHDVDAPPPVDHDGQIVALTFADPDLLTEQIHRLGPLKAVVLAPRWFGRSFFLADPPDLWDRAFALNFEQAVFALQAAARSLIVGGSGGSIIVLSSVAALRPHTELAAVGASLAALHVIARLLAVDLGAQDIRVNVVAMGWTEATWDAAYASAAATERLAEVTPTGRLATIADIGAACRVLIADDLLHLTGAVIPVDGGYTIEKAAGAPPAP
jgi:NAD(P)-dependent dehydrogenase (short-subunit alcohol dehydrogenase family)